MVTGWSSASAETSLRLNPGAIEMGVNGTMVTVEGITSGAIGLDGAWFLAGAGGLFGLEAGWGFRHVESFTETELGADVSWQRRFRDSSAYPYVAVGAGLRHENVGSFGHTRYPVGFSVGARGLVGQRGGLRVEYRYRHVLNDPVSSFSEHQVTIGVALYFRNANVRSDKIREIKSDDR